MVDFEKDVTILRHRDKIEKMLRRIQKEGRDKYLISCTGHQGEPRAILSRMSRGELDFKFEQGDIIAFSCQIIPVEVNIENRARLEKNLRAHNVRIFKDVHVSGHGALEDHRDLMELTRPKCIIPIHAGEDKEKMLAKFAAQLGFDNTKIMKDGDRLILE